MSISATELLSITENVISKAAWLDFPKQLSAPAPHDKSRFAEWRIDFTAVHNDYRLHNLRQPALDLWSLVIGKVPPIQDCDPRQKKPIGIEAAHACFMGVNRPIGEDPTGSNLVAYVTKPTFCFKSTSSGKSAFRITEKLYIPSDVVFVTYVKLDAAYSENGENTGVVSHWSMVESHASDRLLPRDYGTRFARRLW